MFAEGYGHGPLDPQGEEQWSDDEDSEDDPYVHVFFNDGNTLRYMPVARHLLQDPLSLPLLSLDSGEDSDDDEEADALETLLRIGAMLEEQEGEQDDENQNQPNAAALFQDMQEQGEEEDDWAILYE